MQLIQMAAVLWMCSDSRALTEEKMATATISPTEAAESPRGERSLRRLVVVWYFEEDGTTS